MGSVATCKATGLIRVIKTPRGEAPLSVRRSEVGLILPCHPFAGPPDDGMDRGLVSGKKTDRNTSSYSVPQDKFLEILERDRPSENAAWFRKNGFPRTGECFGFQADEVEVVSGVVQKKIINWGDDIPGGPDR